jgi:hypothetical protein
MNFNLKGKKALVFFTSISFLFSITVNAQISEKEISKMFAVKGTYREPFKKASEVGFASVNLRFKLASSEKTEKRDVGNVISWAVLEGVDDKVFQEIANEYYLMLTKKFEENGYKVSDKYKESKGYATLVEKAVENSRITNKKNWGIAEVYTANGAPYIEYPVGMMGAHSKMGNDTKSPVGQLLITIDFAQILQSISKDIEYGFLTNVGNTKTTSSKATIYPVITIEGPSETGLNLKGDGTYAKFAGDNYGFCNAILTINKPVVSNKSYATTIESSKGIPTAFKKFNSDVLGDLAGIFSGGLVKSGKANGEFTFVINADAQKYKAAVLDALNNYNEYLIAYIKANN